MTETPKKFGDRLKLAMQKKMWTARELSAKSTMSEGAISRHLEREEAPKPDSIEKYRAALEVNSEWLAYGRGEMAVKGLTGREREMGRLLFGSESLERALSTYEWPDVDIAIVDAVCADARGEAFSSGTDRPESAWVLRVKQLFRERTGRAKAVPERDAAIPVDPTQESSEIRGARKRPKRL